MGCRCGSCRLPRHFDRQTPESTTHPSRQRSHRPFRECWLGCAAPPYSLRKLIGTGRVWAAEPASQPTAAGLENAPHVYIISAYNRGCILPGSAMKKLLSLLTFLMLMG